MRLSQGGRMTAKTIGLMVPTRGRPALFERFAKSVVQTANDPSRIEIHTYLDRDDPTIDAYAATIERLSIELGPLGMTVSGGIGDPIGVPGAMNELGRTSSTDLLIMSNDDQIYTNFAWVDRLDRETAMFPDGIFLFWFADGIESDRWCCFPIVSRRWIERLNYYAPTMFEHFFVDTWLWDIALRVGRAHYLPDIKVNHIAAWAGKAPKDDTAQRTRGPMSAGRYDRDNMTYGTLERYRVADAEHLRGIMKPSVYECIDGHPLGMPRHSPSQDAESGTIHFDFQPHSTYEESVLERLG